jgi:hypothetical protein
MSYTLAPYVYWQSLDGTGVALALGTVSVYLAGTATPATTYSNSTGTANSWPVQLDSEGRAVIYLDPAFTYKFVVKTAAGVTIPGGTQDIVAAVGAGSAGLGSVFEFGGFGSSPITVTSYPSGATFDFLHPGTAVFQKDSADLLGTYVLQATGVQLTSGTLTGALVNLSDGAPDTPLATCAITSLTGEVANSSAITFGAVGTLKSYGIKTKVSANSGYAWGFKLVRTA